MEVRPLVEYAGKWVGDDIDDIFESILREREVATAREPRI
jgi:hypothetical protein